MCGEHHRRHGHQVRAWGSSPRVRGTQDRGVHDLGNVGIIPACAGNTSAPTSSRTDTRDHPRVCGEHCSIGLNRLRGAGSSPRVRGTLEASDSPYGPNRDHPRVCGEHAVCVAIVPAIRGSSPRVRGTRQANGRRRQAAGIIPACAGNTSFMFSRWACRRDHPRVCGEHGDVADGAGDGAGSSPRVRGTRLPCP